MVKSDDVKPFEAALRAASPPGFTIDPILWTFIRWLERENQIFYTRRSGKIFMPTTPVPDRDHVFSYFQFIAEKNFISQWLGKTGYDKIIFPILRSGSDGSYFAIWKNNNIDRYVFLGSEGDAFLLTDDVKHFIVILTMGYQSVEKKSTLFISPQDENPDYEASAAPYIDAAQRWVGEHLDVAYPACAADLLPKVTQDPFAAFVASATR